MSPQNSIVRFRNDETEVASLSTTSLFYTKTKTGDKHYNAPEMLISPIITGKSQLELPQESMVTRPTRKTDVYSFGVVIFEIISEKIAFASAWQDEQILASNLQKGKREDLTKLPKDTPYGVIQLIQSCWDTDRDNRKSAVECVVKLHPIDLILSGSKTIDILLCPDISYKEFSVLIFHYFLRHSFTVMYDDYDYKEACDAVAKEMPPQKEIFIPHEVEVHIKPEYENICKNMKANYRARIDIDSNNTMKVTFKNETTSKNLTRDLTSLFENFKNHESSSLKISKENKMLDFYATNFETFDDIFKGIRDQLTVTSRH